LQEGLRKEASTLTLEEKKERAAALLDVLANLRLAKATLRGSLEDSGLPAPTARLQEGGRGRRGGKAASAAAAKAASGVANHKEVTKPAPALDKGSFARVAIGVMPGTCPALAPVAQPPAKPKAGSKGAIEVAKASSGKQAPNLAAPHRPRTRAPRADADGFVIPTSRGKPTADKVVSKIAGFINVPAKGNKFEALATEEVEVVETPKEVLAPVHMRKWGKGKGKRAKKGAAHGVQGA
jgi:hypothetical protein